MHTSADGKIARILVGMEQPQGLFIAVEGTDGSGISTQTALLAQWLRGRGRAVHATKEPSGGPVGLLLRLALTQRLGLGGDVGAALRPLDEATMALLFAADRMDHLAAEVEPRLAAGVDVVCDRYILSTYAYQGTGVDGAWLRALNARARVPDLTILLDVPPAVSIARMAARGAVERYEQEETLTSVRAAFHAAASSLRTQGQHIVVLDGVQPLKAVQDAVAATVHPLLAPEGDALPSPHR